MDVLTTAAAEKQCLDATCGSRMMWFDKQDARALFIDNRQLETQLCDGRKLSIDPDMMADFRSLPFDDGTFDHVVFDPPHLVKAGEKSWLAQKYGKLGENWREDLRSGFTECFRVLREGGTLVFKWNETVTRPRPLRSSLRETSENTLDCFRQTTNNNTKRKPRRITMIFKKTEIKKEETININSLPFRTILDEKQKQLSKTAYIVKETIPVVELKFVFHMTDPGHPSFYVTKLHGEQGKELLAQSIHNISTWKNVFGVPVEQVKEFAAREELKAVTNNIINNGHGDVGRIMRFLMNSAGICRFLGVEKLREVSNFLIFTQESSGKYIMVRPGGNPKDKYEWEAVRYSIGDNDEVETPEKLCAGSDESFIKTLVQKLYDEKTAHDEAQ